MSELADSSEKQTALDFLSEYERQMNALMERLRPGDGMNSDEREEVREMYRSLKESLKADKHRLESTQRRGEITHLEYAFLLPTVSEALTELRPAVNSNPIKSRWDSAVYAAHVDISHTLCELRGQSEPEAGV